MFAHSHWACRATSELDENHHTRALRDIVEKSSGHGSNSVEQGFVIGEGNLLSPLPHGSLSPRAYSSPHHRLRYQPVGYQLPPLTISNKLVYQYGLPPYPLLIPDQRQASLFSSRGAGFMEPTASTMLSSEYFLASSSLGAGRA